MQAEPPLHAESPYAPPRASDGPAAPDAPEITAARVAGGLIAFAGLMIVGSSILSFVRRPAFWSRMPGVALIGAFTPAVVGGAVAAALAIPLLRGNRRFRVLAMVRGALAPLSSLAMRGMARVTPRGADMLMLNWNVRFVHAFSFFAAVVILLVGRPGRGRLIAGSVLAALHILFWAMLRFNLLAF